jgi:hypothetical protein
MTLSPHEAVPFNLNIVFEFHRAVELLEYVSSAVVLLFLQS